MADSIVSPAGGSTGSAGAGAGSGGGSSASPSTGSGGGGGSSSSPSPSSTLTGGGDLESMIMAELSSGDTPLSSTSPSDAPPEVPEEELGDDTTTTDPAAKEEPEPAAPTDLDPATPATDEDVDPEIGPPAISKDAKGKEVWSYSKSRAQTLIASHQYFRQVEDIAPTVEDVKTHFRSHMAHQEMMDDLASTDPAAADKFLGHWNKLSPQSVQSAFKIMLDYLPQNDEGAYNLVRTASLSMLAKEFRAEADAAKAANSPDFRKLDWAAKTVEWLGGRPGKPPAGAPPSPQDLREQELNQRDQALREEEQSRVQQAQQTFKESTFTSIRSTVDDLIDKALSDPLKALKSSNPTRYEKAKAELRSEIRKAIAGSQDWQAKFNRDFSKAIANTRSEADRTALSQTYVAKATRELNRLKTSIINDYSAAFINASNQRHERLANGANEKDLSARGNGTAPRAVSRKYDEAKTVGGKVNALLGVE